MRMHGRVYPSTPTTRELRANSAAYASHRGREFPNETRNVITNLLRNCGHQTNIVGWVGSQTASGGAGDFWSRPEVGDKATRSL